MASVGDRPIVLIGMMGAGKSTVGRRLAGRLARPFVDLDERVVTAEGATIADIFDVAGSARFRNAETRALEEVFGLGEAPVVATGGGVILRHRNRELLADDACVVWLDAPVDVLLDRVGTASDRPLLAPDPAARLTELLLERRQLYKEAADVRVDASGAVDEIVDALVAELGA